jgi:hypothetical protein
MREYNLIIILSSSVELVYTTMTLIAMPVADLLEGKLFLMNTGLFEHAPQPYALILSAAWLWAMYTIVVNTTMIFVYRYSIICRQKPMSMRKFALIYGLLVIYVGVHVVLSYWCTERDVYANGYINLIRKNKMFEEDTPTVSIWNPVRVGITASIGCSKNDCVFSKFIC